MDLATEHNLAASMTSDTTELIPFIPYLLQDFWELGSSPQDMVDLLSIHVPAEQRTRALDLGCGKGAVSIALAERLGMHVKGIDAIPQFIGEARRKAVEHGVAELCTFEIGDITHSVTCETGYDCTVYGAVGPALGSPECMLSALKRTVRSGGYVLLDDAYVEGNAAAGEALPLDAWHELFEKAGFEVLACRPGNDESLEAYTKELVWITKRVEELCALYPDRKELFEHYLEQQKNEYNDLLTDIIGATWLLRSS